MNCYSPRIDFGLGPYSRYSRQMEFDLRNFSASSYGAVHHFLISTNRGRSISCASLESLSSVLCAVCRAPYGSTVIT